MFIFRLTNARSINGRNLEMFTAGKIISLFLFDRERLLNFTRNLSALLLITAAENGSLYAVVQLGFTEARTNLLWLKEKFCLLTFREREKHRRSLQHFLCPSRTKFL
jgi:hypothetical protein